MADREDEKEPEVDEDPTARSIVLEEARRTVDRQNTEIDGIDDKAARTVRITVLIIGAFASAPVISNQTIELSLITKVGLVFLMASLFMGVLTYATSSTFAGSGPSDLNQDIGDDSSPEAVREELLGEYKTGISENADAILTASFGLFVSQVLFIVGAVFAVIGVFLL